MKLLNNVLWGNRCFIDNAGGGVVAGSPSTTQNSETRAEPRSPATVQNPLNAHTTTTVHVHQHVDRLHDVHHVADAPMEVPTQESPVVPPARKVKVVRPVSPVHIEEPPASNSHHHHHHATTEVVHHHQQPPQQVPRSPQHHDIRHNVALVTPTRHHDDNDMIIRVVESQGPMGQSIVRHEERHRICLTRSPPNCR